MPRFRGMPTGIEAFLEPPGAFGLRPCVRTHLRKSIVSTRPFGGTEDKYRWLLSPGDGAHFDGLWYQRHGSGRVRHVYGLTYVAPQGAVLLGSNSPPRSLVYCLAPGEPIFRGMLTGPEAFGEYWASLGFDPVPRPTLKKVFVPHSSIWWGVREIPLITKSIKWGTFRPAVVSAACLSRHWIL